MAAPRKVDPVEVRRVFRETGNKNEVARRLGISNTRVAQIVDPRQYAQMRTYHALWQMTGTCPGCGRSGTTRRSRYADLPEAFCRECWAERASTSVRPTTLQCGTCQRWLPDACYPWDRGGRLHRRGRHGQCTECQTKARTAYRERNRVPCEDCGTPVEGKGRPNSRTARNGKRRSLDPDRPFLCHPCFLRRRAVAA